MGLGDGGVGRVDEDLAIDLIPHMDGPVGGLGQGFLPPEAGNGLAPLGKEAGVAAVDGVADQHGIPHQLGQHPGNAHQVRPPCQQGEHHLVQGLGLGKIGGLLLQEGVGNPFEHPGEGDAPGQLDHRQAELVGLPKKIRGKIRQAHRRA